MLENKVGSLKASCINKALDAVNGMPTIETSANGQGTLAGNEVNTMATYSSVMRADGAFYGECNAGIIMAQDGVATFKATGIGKPTSDGGFSFKGSVYFETVAPSLSSLNGAACMYTWEVDASGNAECEIWEIS
ncbi:MAG: hypothetical protein P8M15_05010 [Alphaproteobacteria bacterium]|nr:hypothetical protein [Alphaproteobacteria bacterium]